MRRQLIRSAALAGAVAVAAITAVGGATPRAHAVGLSPALSNGWKKVTSTGLGDQAQLALARGADEVLHALWMNGQSSHHYAIMDTPITGSGHVGKAITVASHLADPSAPDAAVTAAGIDAFWGDGTPPGAVFEAIHPLKRGRWSFNDSTPVLRNVLYVGTVGATVDKSGKAWIGFVDGNDCGKGGQEAACVEAVGHTKVSVPIPGGCCAYDTNLAVDGRGGEKWLGYVSDGSRAGFYVQSLGPAGTAAGSPTRLPGSAGLSYLDQRLPVTGRGIGRSGVYAGYTAAEKAAGPCKVYLYKLGAKAATTMGHNPACSTGPTDVVADPNGRLWILWAVWSDHSSTVTLFYRRSNPRATSFGPTERVMMPRNLTVWSLVGNAQPGRLDVLALVSPGYDYITKQVIVRLNISYRTYKNKKHVSFLVTNQGTPVPASRVSFCGLTKATNASGHVIFAVRKVGSGGTTVRASKPTYASAVKKVTAIC